MIAISGLRKAFGSRDVFTDATAVVGARDRVALVGPNGSGKTTLLRMIAGEDRPDAGRIQTPGGAVIGYLRQDVDHLRGSSVIEAVLAAGSEVTTASHSLGILQGEIAEVPDGPERDCLISEFGHLEDRFSSLGGYSLDNQARRILAGLGFTEEQFRAPLESLSGGRMMRVALARLLLAAPDVLLLDEPTNHLDVDSVAWLENFLQTYDGAVVLVAHDRDLIDAVANRVVEIDNGRLVSYSGNYSVYVAHKEVQARRAGAAVAQQRLDIEAAQRFIERFRAKNTKARQVQSRIKALERMPPTEVVRANRAISVRWPPPPRAGRVVAQLSGVGFSFGDNVVYEDVDFTVERNDKVALAGPNGSGKSTLLKLIAGVLEPQTGTRTQGHNTTVAYFAQHQVDALDDTAAVLEEMERSIPAGINVAARDLLGRFLFSGDDVYKSVGVLSGGERTRLALAKLLVSPANLLCLDEPTNHLDIASRTVVEEALAEYRGALVLVTHDRRLMRAVANRIALVGRKRLEALQGGWDDFIARRGSDAPAPIRPARAKGPSRRDKRRSQADQRARTAAVRADIGRIERDLEIQAAELQALSARLADPGLYESGEDIAAVVARYESVTRTVAELEADWDAATAGLEA